MRIGMPTMATIVLGFLLCTSGGAAPADVVPAAPRSSVEALDRYAVLTRRALALREERRSAELALAVARRSLVRVERRLGGRLRALYETGSPDPVEVLLDAGSLDEALVRLEGLQHIAKEEAEQVDELRRSRQELSRLVQSLTAREAEARRLRVEAARLLRARARAHAGPPRSSPPRDEPQTPSGSLLTVVASGYAIAGLTASGLPAGVGTVAVDPAVIPLGASLTIPGYGSGVAADTGGAVRGAAVDLWFETEAEARAWGRRVVTIVVTRG